MNLLSDCEIYIKIITWNNLFFASSKEDFNMTLFYFDGLYHQKLSSCRFKERKSAKDIKMNHLISCTFTKIQNCMAKYHKGEALLP